MELLITVHDFFDYVVTPFFGMACACAFVWGFGASK